MSDTLLSIVQDATDELLLARPGIVVGNADPQIRQLLALSNAQGEDLASQCDWDGLQRLYTFSTVINQAEYAFPSDFDHIIIDTVWDRSELTPIVGPVPAATWQAIKSGLIGSGIYFRRYRILRPATGTGKRFVIDPPAPASGDTLAFEYVSNAWCQLADGSAVNATWQDDTDTTLLPRTLMLRGLIWRWKRANGFAFTTELAEYNEKLDVAMSRDRPSPGVSMTGPALRQQFLGWPNIPDTGYG